MKRTLDRSRPFSTFVGGVYDAYGQDGFEFNTNGEQIGGEDVAEPEPLTVEQPKEDHVKLEPLQEKLRALGIKFHHRAGVSTLEKLLESAELKKSEREQV